MLNLFSPKIEQRDCVPFFSGHLLSILIAFICLYPCCSTVALAIDKGQIAFNISWLADESHSIPSSKILHSPEKYRFERVANKTSFGVSRATLWFKIDIPPQRVSQRAFLEVDYPVLDSLNIFLETESIWHVTRMGDTRPAGLRKIAHPHFIKELRLSTNKPLRVFLRVQSAGPISVPITLWKEAAYHTHDRNKTLITGLGFGLLLALSILNMFNYFTVRDISYIYYVGYLSFISLFLFSTSGLLALYILPNSPQIANRLPFIFLYTAIISGLNFACSINKIPLFLPLLNKLIKIFCFALCFILIVGQVTTIRFLSIATPALGLISLGFALCTVIVGIRNKYKPSYLVGFAFSTIFIGGLFYALGATGIITKGIRTEFAFQIAVSIEAFLLSFALAYQIRYRERELSRVRETARQERVHFSQKLLETRDLERRQIATELSNGVGSSLFIINQGLGNLLSPHQQKESHHKTIQPLLQILQEAISDVRGLSHRLHPHILDRLGLKEAVIAVIKDASAPYNVHVHYQIENISLQKQSSTSLHIYRIIQESINNILLHTLPVRMEINVRQSSDAIELHIEDFAEKTKTQHRNSKAHNTNFSLSSTQERVKILTGKIVLLHKSSGGMKLDIKIPFEGK